MDYDFYLNKLNSIFEQKYVRAYNNIKYADKYKINEYLQGIYRKWYFSALIEETFLSPANIITRLKTLYDIPYGVFDCIDIINPISKKIRFSYERIDYSSPNLPVINDLKLFIKQCEPFMQLDENGEVMLETKNILKGKISIPDNYYINYLLDIACRLGICCKAPSIHLTAVQPTKSERGFFKRSPKIIFAEIFRATCEIFADFLNSTLPFGGNFEEFVLSILEQPVSTEEIYRRIYASNGIDIDTIWDESGDEADFPQEIKEYLRFGIFYLGIGIDKHFFTPMGYYLKIIRPLYLLPIKMNEDMAVLYNSICEEKIIDAELYSPCSEYALTRLGSEMLSKDYSSNDLFQLDNNEEELKSLIMFISSSESQEDKFLINGHGGETIVKDDKIDVWQLKISLIGKEKLWFKMEMDADTSLSELHFHICYMFDLETFSDYSFYIGLEETPFKRITPIAKKIRTRKAELVKLSDIEIAGEGILKYVTKNVPSIFDKLFSGKIIKFKIEFVKMKTDEYEPLFPRIYRKSKFLSGFLTENNINY